MLDRAIKALPINVKQARLRWDAGYFAAKLASACSERDIEFAVAVIDYLPGTWPKNAGITCIARQTRIPADRIPTARARKRRTIDKHQLALALEGRIDEVYGYSFILTNMDVTGEEKLAQTEWWYRHRTAPTLRN